MSKPGPKVASMGAPPCWKPPNAISAPLLRGVCDRKACMRQGQRSMLLYRNTVPWSPNTHISRPCLRRVDETILVVAAIAVDMRQKILGAVGRAAHAIGHLEDSYGCEVGQVRLRLCGFVCASRKLGKAFLKSKAELPRVVRDAEVVRGGRCVEPSRRVVWRSRCGRIEEGGKIKRHGLWTIKC